MNIGRANTTIRLELLGWGMEQVNVRKNLSFIIDSPDPVNIIDLGEGYGAKDRNTQKQFSGKRAVCTFRRFDVPSILLSWVVPNWLGTILLERWVCKEILTRFQPKEDLTLWSGFFLPEDIDPRFPCLYVCVGVIDITTTPQKS
jgi:hypothetical protein